MVLTSKINFCPLHQSGLRNSNIVDKFYLIFFHHSVINPISHGGGPQRPPVSIFAITQEPWKLGPSNFSTFPKTKLSKCWNNNFIEFLYFTPPTRPLKRCTQKNLFKNIKFKSQKVVCWPWCQNMNFSTTKNRLACKIWVLYLQN